MIGSINSVDLHVGTQVRNRRRALGMSQQDLAEALDLSFQQIQKYEKGTNRMSASKLFETACKLQVPITFFFEDLPGTDTFRSPVPQASTAAFQKTPLWHDFAKALAGIRSKRKLLALFALAKDLTEDG